MTPCSTEYSRASATWTPIRATARAERRPEPVSSAEEDRTSGSELDGGRGAALAPGAAGRIGAAGVAGSATVGGAARGGCGGRDDSAGAAGSRSPQSETATTAAEG